MLDWNELAVLTTAGCAPNQVMWRPNDRLFSAETCARHIYVGRSDDFGLAADALLGHKATQIYRGMDGYRFFMEFFVGLKGHYESSDKEASGQTRDAWNDYGKKHPEEQNRLKPFMDEMFADGRMIKSAILQPYLRRPTLVNTAVSMADMSKDSRVLIIGGAKALTIETITALGHGKRNTPDKIYLTHPSGEETNNILKDVRGLPNFRAISSELVPVSFESVTREDSVVNMFNAESIFTCMPMTEKRKGAEADANCSIADAWELRAMFKQNEGAQLLHLKGDPLKRGETTGIWKDVAKTTDFIPYTKIFEENGKRIAFTKAVTAKASEAIEHFAILRASGDRVRMITFEADAVNGTVGEIKYKLATRPRLAAQTKEAAGYEA